MRIFITGASGMLGEHIVDRYCESGQHEVIGLDVAPSPPPRPRYRHVVADVRNRTALASCLPGVDVVIHCAAALPSSSRSSIRSTDVEGTGAVLAAARDAGVGRVVHVSSTAVYGLPKMVPTPEDYPLTAEDAYSGAKIEAELLCREARKQGMVVPILRPKTFLGPRRMGLFAMLFEWAHEGRNFPVIGSGRVRCQMLDVRDLADAIDTVLTADSEVCNTEFNLGATRFDTLRDDFQSVLNAAGHGKRVIGVPIGPAVLVLRLLAGMRLSPVYRRLIHKLCADSYVSTQRAQERLGFAPRYSNTDTLLETFEWWRSKQGSIGRVRSGRTHRQPWRQGALRLVKGAF